MIYSQGYTKFDLILSATFRAREYPLYCALIETYSHAHLAIEIAPLELSG